MIVVVVPVLSRPDRVRPLLANITESTRVPHRVVFMASPDDRDELLALDAANADYLVMDERPGPGDYQRKINRGYRESAEPFIFTGADDLVFHRGWDTAALAKMKDERIGVVGTNDLGNPKVLAGEHSTHSLIRRSYADNFGTIDCPGKILHEEYVHEFCDDELIGTAKCRGAFAMASDSIVEHIHPHWAKRPEDHLTTQAPRRLVRGRRIFHNRRHLWAYPGSLGMSSISVIVATFGDSSWKARASRAIRSVESQSMSPIDIHYIHGDNLADARNEGAKLATGPWLCFLDADDELAPGYLEAMQHAIDSRLALLNPAVQFITPDDPSPAPKLFKPRDLSMGNYLVIGTVMRTDLFWEAGGFDPKFRAWEDWSVMRRIHHLNPRIFRVPKAIYRAYWYPDGRNNTIRDPEQLREEISEDFERWKAAR